MMMLCFIYFIQRFRFIAHNHPMRDRCYGVPITNEAQDYIAIRRKVMKH